MNQTLTEEANFTSLCLLSKGNLTPQALAEARYFPSYATRLNRGIISTGEKLTDNDNKASPQFQELFRMKILVYSAKSYDKNFITSANKPYNYEIDFIDEKLTLDTANRVSGHQVVCTFVNDCLDEPVIQKLAELKVKLIALRCAGYNQVDMVSALKYSIPVVRVPSYSPHAVAEHTLGLMLALNRKIYKAYNRVREDNFSLEGLLGFDFHGKIAGIIGTGQIGSIVAKLLQAMGMKVIAYDPYPNPTCQGSGVEYTNMEVLLQNADVISLHCPLTSNTHHLINTDTLRAMKPGVMLINTGRGAMIDTDAVIQSLKNKQIGYLGLDVYEHEETLFFENLSDQIIVDDSFERLLTFPNVLITGHQGFFTTEALYNIAQTTLKNISEYTQNQPLSNQISIS